MDRRELYNYFNRRYRDDCHADGAWRFFLKESDGHLVCFPSLSNVSKTTYIYCALAMRPKWFDDLTLEIFGADGGSYLFKVGEDEIKVAVDGEGSETHIENLINMALTWYDRCCEEKAVYAELSRKYLKHNVPGGWQFTHIIACVVKGDIEKLNLYIDSFERGDRIGFIPLIKLVYFQRALAVAKNIGPTIRCLNKFGIPCRLQALCIVSGVLM